MHVVCRYTELIVYFIEKPDTVLAELYFYSLFSHLQFRKECSRGTADKHSFANTYANFREKKSKRP
jgi:hypothetical protein